VAIKSVAEIRTRMATEKISDCHNKMMWKAVRQQRKWRKTREERGRGESGTM
jgi:hypothetical protein